MFPCPIFSKKWFDGWCFYFSFYYFFCLNVITICMSMILHNTHMVFASTLLALHLFVTHPCSFFFDQVVRKPLKFINNVLQTNVFFLNESNFPIFLSLCAFILGHCLGKCSKYQYQRILLFLDIWLGIMKY